MTKTNYQKESLIKLVKEHIDFQSDKIITFSSKVMVARKQLEKLSGKKKLSEDETKRKTEAEAEVKTSLKDLEAAQLRAETLVELLEKYENNEPVSL